MNETERLKQENQELRIRNLQLTQMNERLIIDKARLLRKVMDAAVDAIFTKEG